MKLQMFQVDAFTDQVFRGYPAAVVPLETKTQRAGVKIALRMVFSGA